MNNQSGTSLKFKPDIGIRRKRLTHHVTAETGKVGWGWRRGWGRDRNGACMPENICPKEALEE